MSGPKIDHVELERRRQEELKRQRQERVSALSVYRDAVAKAVAKAEYAKEKYMRMLEVVRGIDAFKDCREHIITEHRLCVASINKKMRTSLPDETNHQAYIVTLENMRKELEDATDSEIKGFEQRIQDDADRIQAHEKVKAILHEGNKAQFTNSTEQLFLSEEEQHLLIGKTTAVSERRKLAAQLAKAALDSSYLVGQKKEHMDKLALELEESPEKDAESIIDDIISLYCTLEDDKQKYGEYVSVVTYLNEQHGFSQTVRGMNEFQDAREVMELRESIQNRIDALEEREYIRRQIQEVMEECGYNQFVPLEIEDVNGASHYLATATEENMKGVEDAPTLHIRVANGVMMMEVVAIDDSGADESVQEKAEGEAVVLNDISDDAIQMQTTFCKQRPEMIRKLEKRGVLLGVNKHLDIGKIAKEIRLRTVPVGFRLPKSRREAASRNEGTAYQGRALERNLN